MGGLRLRRAEVSRLKSQLSSLEELNAHTNESSNLKLATSAKRAPEGYAYIFPKRDHVNIGIGYVLSHYRHAIDAAPYSCNGATSRGSVTGAWSSAIR